MGEELFEFWVPYVLFWLNRPFEDDLFYVVIEDFRGISSKILEGMQVTFDEGLDVGGEGELHISHTGIAKDHAEAVESSQLAIHLNTITYSPVYLDLDAGFCLIPVHCRYTFFRAYLPYEILYDCVASRESLILDLPVDPGDTEWVFPDPFVDVVLVVIQFARLVAPLLSNWWLVGSDVFPYCSPVIPCFPGDLIDGHPLRVEIS